MSATKFHKTTGKIIILYILIFVYFDNKLKEEKKNSAPSDSKHFPDFNRDGWGMQHVWREGRGVYGALVGKPEGKRPLG
jgi:hypothetical protein